MSQQFKKGDRAKRVLGGSWRQDGMVQGETYTVKSAYYGAGVGSLTFEGVRGTYDAQNFDLVAAAPSPEAETKRIPVRRVEDLKVGDVVVEEYDFVSTDPVVERKVPRPTLPKAVGSIIRTSSREYIRVGVNGWVPIYLAPPSKDVSRIDLFQDRDFGNDWTLVKGAGE